MNRKERRAAAKRNLGFSAGTGRSDRADRTPSVADLMDEARSQHRQANLVQAERLCKQILERNPTHVHSLNLIGIIAQSSGRYQLSIKMFTRALGSDPLNAACHYNLGSSYQALDRAEEAATHFRKAIVLGLSEKNVEEFIKQNPIIARYLDRVETADPLSHQSDEPSDTALIDAVADDLFLRCAMECTIIRGRMLEIFLTNLRLLFLRLAVGNAVAPVGIAGNVISCVSALAQQCFMNEYIYSQRQDETQQSTRLRDLLVEQLNATSGIDSLTLAAVATYFSLHQIPGATQILNRNWHACLVPLVRQQVREPLEEKRDRLTIPALTGIENSSLRVMHQYEENPYPRWTFDAHTELLTDRITQEATIQRFDGEILIAGCGTGRHVLQVARQYPKAAILAIDISLPSLAYANRKMGEAGVHNVKFAHADILKLEAIDRKFDRIEAVGVLHHLVKPEMGLRILLSLLQPGGKMRIGLYSEAARRGIVEARAIIKKRGYRPTVGDIRMFREEIFRDDVDGRWRMITGSTDFYSVSGCRDLLFNVMEHRFTMVQISELLARHGLSFLGFEGRAGDATIFPKPVS